jgi:hypothetical protein
MKRDTLAMKLQDLHHDRSGAGHCQLLFHETGDNSTNSRIFFSRNPLTKRGHMGANWDNIPPAG